MTLVVAAPSTNFLVLGADSRGTVDDSGGARCELNQMKKILPVAKHVAVLIYGSAEHANYLITKFKTSNKELDGVTKTAERLADFCREEMKKVRDVALDPKYFPYFGFLVAGLDKQRGQYKIPHCYSLDSYSGFILGSPQSFAIAGRPFIALYLFAQKYRENMSLDELCELVAQSLYDTICVDGNVGGKIRLTIIDSDGIRERQDRDVRRSIRQWGEPLV